MFGAPGKKATITVRDSDGAVIRANVILVQDETATTVAEEINKVIPNLVWKDVTKGEKD